MPDLFHYTSNAGAIGIIESGCLYATHYRYLNDSAELALAIEILTPIVANEFRSEIERQRAQGAIREDELERLGPDLHEREASKLVRISFKLTDKHTPVFIASLCQHEAGTYEHTHGLLSQWRGYGASGGCALVFYVDELHPVIQNERDRYGFTLVSLLDVLYERHEEAIDHDGLRRFVPALLRHLVERSAESEARYNERVDALYRLSAQVAPRLKSIGFSEEREVRIVAPRMGSGAAREHPNREGRPIHFRYRNGMPIPYVRLFEGGPRLPIRRIIVGPQHEQGKVAQAIRLALEAKGMEAEITASETSYVP